MRVLVTGASGLLGLNLSLMKASQYEIIGVVNQAVLKNAPFQLLISDLSQQDAVEKAIDDLKPDLVINCAAMAAVDQCEDTPQQAHRINAWMPGRAAARCSHHRIPFIHISTDAVFDGEKGGYTEGDAPNPLSVYAKTKLEGETRVMDAYPDALITRVNFFGHSLSGKRSLAEFFLYKLLDGSVVKGFTDVFFSPLYVRHLVEMLFTMAHDDLYGIYHVVGSERISKFDFGCRIAERLSKDCSLITPISYQDADLLAKRSPNLFLDTSKLTGEGIEVPSLDEGLDNFFTDYRDGWQEKFRSCL